MTNCERKFLLRILHIDVSKYEFYSYRNTKNNKKCSPKKDRSPEEKRKLTMSTLNSETEDPIVP